MILRIEYKDLEHAGFDGGGSEILHYKKKPFTGTMIDYEDDGSLAFEIEYENGYREGWIRYYHPNGQLEEEHQLHNNVVVSGTFKKYDEEGNYLGGF